MQSVDLSGLKELDKRFADVLQQAPGARRELHERIGRAVERELQSAVRTSGMKNSGGSVPGWQNKHVGSGGGYAAVRADGSKEGAPTGPNSPGAITNYLEGGHKVRRASGRAKRPQKGRAKMLYVKGYRFYANTQTRAESIGIAEAERYAAEIAGKLGD